MTKRLFALLLCTGLVISLAGCGDKNPTKTDVEDAVAISQVSETVDVVSEVESVVSMIESETESSVSSNASLTTINSVVNESSVSTPSQTETNKVIKDVNIIGTPIDFVPGERGAIEYAYNDDMSNAIVMVENASEMIDKRVKNEFTENTPKNIRMIFSRPIT